MNKKKCDTLFVYFKISISDLRNKFPEIETLVNSGNPVYLTKNGYGANSLGGGFCICDKCYDNNKKLAGLCFRMRQRIMQKI